MLEKLKNVTITRILSNGKLTHIIISKYKLSLEILSEIEDLSPSFLYSDIPVFILLDPVQHQKEYQQLYDLGLLNQNIQK